MLFYVPLIAAGLVGFVVFLAVLSDIYVRLRVKKTDFLRAINSDTMIPGRTIVASLKKRCRIIGYGNTYLALKKLCAEGLAESVVVEEFDDLDEPCLNSFFRITPAGREFLCAQSEQ